MTRPPKATTAPEPTPSSETTAPPSPPKGTDPAQDETLKNRQQWRAIELDRRARLQAFAEQISPWITISFDRETRKGWADLDKSEAAIKEAKASHKWGRVNDLLGSAVTGSNAALTRLQTQIEDRIEDRRSALVAQGTDVDALKRDVENVLWKPSVKFDKDKSKNKSPTGDYPAELRRLARKLNGLPLKIPASSAPTPASTAV